MSGRMEASSQTLATNWAPLTESQGVSGPCRISHARGCRAGWKVLGEVRVTGEGLRGKGGHDCGATLNVEARAGKGHCEQVDGGLIQITQITGTALGVYQEERLTQREKAQVFVPSGEKENFQNDNSAQTQ